MAAALITEDDIKLALDGTAETLRELAGDDGTGAARADRVAYGIAVASEDAYGILLAGFGTVEKVQALAANDRRDIRRVTRLRFAQDFAPEAVKGYLERDAQGAADQRRIAPG